MTEKGTIQQIAKETADSVKSEKQSEAGDALSVAERTTRFNRYLYENLVGNVEVQIESWNC